MSRIEERRFATELGVMDARDLIRAKYPAMLTALTPAQIDQVQRQLDAEIINATLVQQKLDHDRKSIVGRTRTGQPVRDSSKAMAPFRARMATIVLKETDTLIRVDHHKLLAPGTFVPTSDNPDEAAYLLQMKAALAEHGVWLRFFFNSSQVGRSYASNDHRRWFANFWYGPDTRDEIKSATGRLDRPVLLAVTVLGSRYYQYVHTGPTLNFLNKAMDALASKINLIRKLHDDWNPSKDGIRTKLLEWGIHQAGKMGGVDAKYPGRNIWNDPSQTLDLARKSKAEGKLTEATKLTAFAAMQAEWGARAVEEYANFINSTKGAVGFALEVHQALVDLGKVADAILIVRWLGKKVILRASGVGAGAAEQATEKVVARQIPDPGPKYHGPSAHAPTHYPGFQEERMVYEQTLDRAATNVTLDSQAGHIVAGDRYAVAEWDRLILKQAEFSREVAAHQKKHGGALSMQMLDQIMDKLDRKYGYSTLKERMGGK